MLKKIGENINEIKTITQGTINKDCFQFKSDVPLTGFPLYVDIGLWAELGAFPKTSPSYYIIYPNIAGTYQLDLIGAPLQNANLECNIIVQDSMKFVIELTYIALADINQGLITTSYDNLDLLIQDKLNLLQTNVYELPDKLSCKVTIERPSGNEYIIYEKLCTGKKWRNDPKYYMYTDYYTLGVQKVDGWVASKDLYIDFYPDETCEAIWYAGIFKSTDYNNNKPFYEDLNLNYAKINGSIAQAHPLIEFNKITEAKEIQNDDLGNGYGQIKIDSSYFENGVQYIIFFIVKNSVTGEYVSYLTSSFGRIDTGNCTPIYPNNDVFIHYETQTPLKTPYNAVMSLAPCQPYRCEVQIDVSDFNTKALAAGYSLTTLNDLIASGSVTVSAIITDTQELYPTVLDNLVIVENSIIAGEYVIIAEGLLNESYQGSTKTVQIFVKVQFPEGILELIYPFLIHIVAYGNLPNLVTNTDEYICDDIQELELCFDGVPSTDKLYVYDGNKDTIKDQDNPIATYDDDFTGGDACIQIDLNKITQDDQKCLCVYSMPTPIAPPGSCPCNDLIINIDLENKEAGYDFTIEFDWSNFAPSPSDAWAWELTQLHRAFNYPLGQDNPNVTVNKIKFSGKWSDKYKNHLYFFFIVVTSNGCIYQVFVNPKSFNIPGSQELYITQSGTYNVEVCEVVPTQTIPCNWNPSINTTCNEFQGTLLTDEDGGTIIQKQWSYDLITWNNYTVPVSFLSNEKIYFWVVIDPPANSFPCKQVSFFGSVKAKDCGLCYDLLPINQCADLLEIVQAWDEGGELLTLNETLNGDCVPLYDHQLKYSYDGINYVDYVAGVDTSGVNYVYYFHYIDCENGCSIYESGVWERVCKIDPCPVISPSCECIASVEVSEIENEYTAQHYNPYLGTGSQTFDSHFIAEDGYPERVVISSKIRVDFKRGDDIVQTCYYERKGFYQGSYFNDNGTALGINDYIGNVLFQLYDSTGKYFVTIICNCSSVIFAGNGATFAAAVKAKIDSDIAGYGYSAANYSLTVTCTNAGVFKISMKYQDSNNVPGWKWIGIDKANAYLEFFIGGSIYERYHNDPLPNTQGQPEYIEFDPPIPCSYNDECGNSLSFTATPNGGTGLGTSDYRYVIDTESFNWFNIPLNNEAYTVGGGSLSSNCVTFMLIGLTENMGSPITHEWREGVTVLGTNRVLLIDAGHIITYEASGSECTKTVEIEI